MPPWIASSRSLSVLMIRGSSILARKPNTTTKTMVPMISSGQVGISGFCAASAARGSVILACPFPVWPQSGCEDERRHKADQGQRLGQREADPHVKGDPAGRLGLAAQGLDGVTEDEADSHAVADGGDTLPEAAQTWEAAHRGGG